MLRGYVLHSERSRFHRYVVICTWLCVKDATVVWMHVVMSDMGKFLLFLLELGILMFSIVLIEVRLIFFGHCSHQRAQNSL